MTSRFITNLGLLLTTYCAGCAGQVDSTVPGSGKALAAETSVGRPQIAAAASPGPDAPYCAAPTPVDPPAAIPASAPNTGLIEISQFEDLGAAAHIASPDVVRFIRAPSTEGKGPLADLIPRARLGNCVAADLDPAYETRSMPPFANAGNVTATLPTGTMNFDFAPPASTPSEKATTPWGYKLTTTLPGLSLGDVVNVDATGADAPAFHAALSVPGAAHMTLPIVSDPLTHGNCPALAGGDLHLAWTADGSGVIQVALSALASDGHASELLCQFDLADGCAVIPREAIIMMSGGPLRYGATLIVSTSSTTTVRTGDWDMTVSYDRISLACNIDAN